MLVVYEFKAYFFAHELCFFFRFFLTKFANGSPEASSCTSFKTLTFKTFFRVMRKFDLAIAPTTPPLATPGTVKRSGDSGPQIDSHRQHLYDSQY